jgi:hypothetical protein
MSQTSTLKKGSKFSWQQPGMLLLLLLPMYIGTNGLKLSSSSNHPSLYIGIALLLNSPNDENCCCRYRRTAPMARTGC